MTTVTTTARAATPAFQTDRSVGVVDEAEIAERQPSTMADVIAEEPGVYRQATNRGSDSVYMRGLIGPENLIVVDGVRFNQSTFRTGPNQYLATLDPWAMGRAEVVRGPGGVLFGSGAMGGVVQFFPRQIPADPLSGRAIFHFGSADRTLGGAFDGAMRRGPLGITLGGSLRDHGELRAGTRGGEGLFLSAEEDGRFLGSEFRQIFWRLGVETDISEATDFRLTYMGGEIDDARRTDQLGRGQIRSTDNRDDLLLAHLRTFGAPFAEELTVFAAYHRTEEEVRRYQCSTETLDRQACAALNPRVLDTRRDLRDVVNTVGAGTVATSSVLPMLRLTYGGEFYHDHVLSSRFDSVGPDLEMARQDRGNFADGSTYTTMGVFTHGDYSLWASGLHEVALTGGARVEHFRAEAPEVTPEIGDVTFDNTGLVGALGVSYLFDTHLNAYFNWSQGFRSPNLQESTVLGDTGNFYEVPNPDLRPERSDTFELGLKTDLAGTQVALSLFSSLLRDRITGVDGEFEGQEEIDGKPIRIRVNADRAYFYGAELGFRSRPVSPVEFFGNLAWIDGAVESGSEDPFFEAGPLHGLFAGDRQWTTPRRLPPLQFMAGMTYHIEALDLSATVFAQGAGPQTRLSSGDRNDLRICEIDHGVLAADGACEGTPGWATLNARASYDLAEHLQVQLAVTNLLDQRYQYHGSGLFGPGRQALLTLTSRL